MSKDKPIFVPENDDFTTYTVPLYEDKNLSIWDGDCEHYNESTIDAFIKDDKGQWHKLAWGHCVSYPNDDEDDDNWIERHIENLKKTHLMDGDGNIYYREDGKPYKKIDFKRDMQGSHLDVDGLFKDSIVIMEKERSADANDDPYGTNITKSVLYKRNKDGKYDAIFSTDMTIFQLDGFPDNVYFLGGTYRNKIGLDCFIDGKVDKETKAKIVDYLTGKTKSTSERYVLGWQAVKALEKGDDKMFALCVAKGAEPNKIYANGLPLLACAQTEKQTKILLKAGAEPNLCEKYDWHFGDEYVKNCRGPAALWQALAEQKPIGVIKTLLENGADPNLSPWTNGNDDERSPLMMAKTKEQAKLLLEYGADLDYKCYVNGELTTARNIMLENGFDKLVDEYSTPEAKEKSSMQRKLMNTKQKLKESKGALKGKQFGKSYVYAEDDEVYEKPYVRHPVRFVGRYATKIDDKGMVVERKKVEPKLKRRRISRSRDY